MPSPRARQGEPDEDDSQRLEGVQRRVRKKADEPVTGVVRKWDRRDEQRQPERP